MLSNTSKVEEICELREQLKEYLYLYYMTKDNRYKIVITIIGDSIKYLESMLNSNNLLLEKNNES